MKHIECNILDDISNLSDHQAICLAFYADIPLMTNQDAPKVFIPTQ